MAPLPPFLPVGRLRAQHYANAPRDDATEAAVGALRGVCNYGPHQALQLRRPERRAVSGGQRPGPHHHEAPPPAAPAAPPHPADRQLLPGGAD